MGFYRDVNSVSPTDTCTIEGADSVLLSLRNLLLTRKGERAFDPLYGIDLEALLFDLADDGTELAIIAEIFDAVDAYEPRVNLDKGSSEVELIQDENRVEVTLDFTIEGFDDKLFQITESLTA